MRNGGMSPGRQERLYCKRPFHAIDTYGVVRTYDLLVFCPARYNTSDPVVIAEKARSLHADIALLTTNKAGALSSMTDIKFIIQVVTKETTEIQGRPIQMSGSIYGQLAWICCDAMVVMMMQES